MSALLQVGVTTNPFEQVAADIAAAGFFSSERPLRGAAGRADWRLCGLVTDLLVEGRLRDKVGSAVLVPAFGRMAAARVLLIGLGRRQSLSAARIHEHCAAVARRGILLGARRLALAPPAGDEGAARHAGILLRGALQAVTEADTELELRLVVAESEAAGLQKALERSLEAEPAPEIRLLPPVHAQIGASARAEVPRGLRSGERIPFETSR